MKKKLLNFYQRNRVLIYTIVGIIVLFALWWILALILKTSLFPTPVVVFKRLGELLADSYTYASIGWTLLRLLLATIAGFFLGNAFGIVGGLNENFYNFFRPFIVIFRTIPTATIIYIIIALTRTAYAPVIIVFLIVFPLCYDSMVSGIKSVDEEIVDALKVDGTSLFKAIFKVYIPLSWSYILLGLVSSVGLGMKVCIMSEILAGDNYPGIGRMIYVFSTTVEMDNIIAVSLVAIVLIGTIDIAIYFAKKKLKAVTTKNG